MADLNSQLPVKISDGTNTATVRDTGSNDSLNVAITDASGNQITSFGGGTQYAEDVALGSTPTGTLAMSRRVDTLSTLTPVADDAISTRVNSRGALWTTIDGYVTVAASGGSFAVTALATAPAHVRLSNGTTAYDTVTSSQLPATLDGSGNLKVALQTGSAVIGTLGANSGVDIGDTTINNTASQPIPVYIVSSGLNEVDVVSYATSAALGASSTANIDYTITSSKLFSLSHVVASASGKIKVVVQVGPVASLATKFVFFNSTANPQAEIVLHNALEVSSVSSGTVRVAITNLESASMDVYATIMGTEI